VFLVYLFPQYIVVNEVKNLILNATYKNAL